MERCAHNGDAPNGTHVQPPAKRVRWGEKRTILLHREQASDRIPTSPGAGLSVGGPLCELLHCSGCAVCARVELVADTARQARHYPARNTAVQLARVPSRVRARLLARSNVTIDSAISEEMAGIQRERLQAPNFCLCAEGLCEAGSCSCEQLGVGCWVDTGVGCPCGPACQNPLGVYSFDPLAVKLSRQQQLQEAAARSSSPILSAGSPLRRPFSPVVPLHDAASILSPQPCARAILGDGTDRGHVLAVKLPGAFVFQRENSSLDRLVEYSPSPTPPPLPPSSPLI